MREQLVMGNWKMNGSNELISSLLLKFKQEILDLHATCVIFPPVVYLAKVAEYLAGTAVYCGAQNIYPQDKGAYTGEVSLPMVKECGARYVLVGHSERRHLFHESVEFVAEKFHQAKEHDMIPVLCVGETLTERQEGRTEAVLSHQITSIYRDYRSDFTNCVIAYEPVWAIGTGQTATPNEAQEAHVFIRRLVAEYNQDHAARLSIVYGGSVTEKNAQDLFSMPDVDGGLVGGASLNAQQFLEIVACIKS